MAACKVVGQVLAVFTSWEIKPPGWRYTGAGREGAQMAWANLVAAAGGEARFLTGPGEVGEMSYWEAPGATNEWYTPPYIFKALGERFDLDVAHPATRDPITPCDCFLSGGSLHRPWFGFVWMNPPFGGRNGLVPWLDKFMAHGDGIALVPDRTSAPWWQAAATQADAILFVAGKIRFLRPDGTEGVSPSNGTCLMAKGDRAVAALQRSGLGLVLTRPSLSVTVRQP